MAFAAQRILILSLAFSSALAAAAPSPAPHAIDQARIHASYHDGDFDKVIKELEGFQKSGRTCAPAESLFMEKHLAVVYAANPGTRELGRYHMFRMLDLAPGADLLDMFVGEEVDAVFDKVRKEHSLRPMAGNAAAATSAASARDAAPAGAKSPIRNAAAWPSDTRANAAKPIPRAVARPKASWESAAYDSPARPAAKNPARDNPSAALPASRTLAPTAPARTVPAKSSWDDVGTQPVNAPPARSAVLSAPSDNVGNAGNPFAENARAEKTGFHSDATPAWKEPGLWVGGGAALAVVAFTLFHSGSSPTAQPKTYVVPATAAR